MINVIKKRKKKPLNEMVKNFFFCECVFFLSGRMKNDVFFLSEHREKESESDIERKKIASPCSQLNIFSPNDKQKNFWLAGCKE